jgi:lipoprotein-anchoring transpeptidase ErfK/SrfK
MGRLLTIATALVAAVVLSSGVGIASASPLPSDLPLVYGDRGDTVHKAHYRLNWLGYDLRTKEVDNDFFGRSTKAAVKGFQRKFFLPINGKLNKDTWKMLDKVGDDVGKLPKACLEERQVLCIDKTSKLLRYVLKGKVVQTLDVRFGVPGLDTPTGTYRVWYKDRYATSGIDGPDVPRAPMPYALFFTGDIAVHYSPTFAASGYYPGGGSHGCVNVADLKGVSWLFDQIPVGTRVHVYWS